MFTSVSTLSTLRIQFIPIKFVLEGPLAEVGVHGPSLETKVHRRAEVLREAPERHTQELPIFREEALSINESASNDILFFEGRTVGLKSGCTYFLAAVTGVGVGVLTPARQSVRRVAVGARCSKAHYCRPGHDLDLIIVPRAVRRDGVVCADGARSMGPEVVL